MFPSIVAPNDVQIRRSQVVLEVGASVYQTAKSSVLDWM